MLFPIDIDRCVNPLKKMDEETVCKFKSLCCLMKGLIVIDT